MQQRLDEGGDGYFRQIVEKSFNAVAIIDEDSRVQFWNDAAARMFGYQRSEVIGQPFSELITPERCRHQEREILREYQQSGILSRAGQPMEVQYLRKDGTELWAEMSWTDIVVDGARWAFAVIRDFDARKRREQELAREARTDGLTGLANRREFQRLLEDNLSRKLTVAILDIDQFKGLNDQFGHPIGDDVIQFVSRQIQKQLPKAICLGRLGGDEFGIVLETSDDVPLALRDFEELRRQIFSSSPIESSDVTISIGIVVCHRPNTAARELLTAADRMLYRSKSNGRNSVSHCMIDAEGVVHIDF